MIRHCYSPLSFPVFYVKSAISSSSSSFAWGWDSSVGSKHNSFLEVLDLIPASSVHSLLVGIGVSIM